MQSSLLGRSRKMISSTASCSIYSLYSYSELCTFTKIEMFWRNIQQNFGRKGWQTDPPHLVLHVFHELIISCFIRRWTFPHISFSMRTFERFCLQFNTEQNPNFITSETAVKWTCNLLGFFLLSFFYFCRDTKIFFWTCSSFM